VNSQSIDTNGFGTYQVTIDRTNLVDGTYSASITFDATATATTLNVQMQVATNPITADASYLYILAIDPESGETISTAEAASSNGQYTYSIQDIPSGNYELVAGSDMNNDIRICDSGESCGAYPTLDQNSIITVNENLTGFDFTISFDNQIIANSSSTKDNLEDKSKNKGFERINKAAIKQQ
jgi:serine protease